MSSDYGMFGNLATTEADGKYGGHTAVTLVHPAGISMHTFANCDPDGRSEEEFRLGRYWSKSVQAIVPGGQDTLSGPFAPRTPCVPADPNTELGPQSSAVWFVPFTPAGGILPEVVAKKAVNAVMVCVLGTLAVIADKE